MAMPDWWDTRRYGLFVHSNLATVPAWAPIGQYADWYRSHLGEPVHDVIVHPRPMVEVLAHHRERWGHVPTYDDFLPLLTYDRFDADEWADLARSAGAGYSVFVAKHHDGLCWWDAPSTERTVVRQGPRRNVLAEYAAACERAGIVLGTYYSLLDWADPRYPDATYVDEVLHRHVIDLVERYGSRILWGDGHWGHGPGHWRTRELVDRARARRGDLVVNDRWWADDPDVETFEYRTPAEIVDHPWELCRGLGYSFCHNRAERAEHHLTGPEIVALLTEVLAKGGHLLLNVGPAADGTVPELQRLPLLEAGTWVREHDDVVSRARPWRTWGDDDVRYLVDGRAAHAERAAEQLWAVDVGGRGHFDALGRAGVIVTGVTARDGSPLTWEQQDASLVVRRFDRGHPPSRRPTLASVYDVTYLEPEAAPIRLFAPPDRAPVELAPLVRDARAGEIVQLGDGVHVGPVVVPDGVTVRGLGPGRTIIEGRGAVALVAGSGARLEHLEVRDVGSPNAWSRPAAVRLGDDTTVIGCRIHGQAVIEGDRCRIRGCELDGVVSVDVNELVVSRSHFVGTRWDVALDVRGGYGHVVESCELRHHLGAICVTGALHPVVRGNVVEARWWGVRLVDTDAAHVVANSFSRTMRAVDVDGGSHAVVEGNAVVDGDSGCVVQRGASEVRVAGNRWERCRVGLLAWDAGELRHHHNSLVDLHDPDHGVVVGPS